MASPIVPQKSNPRIQGLDALKAVSVLAVVAIHAPISEESQTLTWQVFNQLCRFAVPCFFLVSGYLFMRAWNKASDKDSAYTKLIKRLVSVFLVWAIFYALVPPFIIETSDTYFSSLQLHIWNSLRYPYRFILYGGAYHLWFLSSLAQSITILYLSLRFFSIYTSLAIGGIFFAIGISIDPYGYPFFGLYPRIPPYAGPLLSTLFVSLGALIAKHQTTLPAKISLLLTISGFLILLSENLTLHSIFNRPLIAPAYSIGTIPYSLGIFFIFLSKSSISNLISKLGLYSLGVYAIHPYVIEVLCSIDSNFKHAPATITILTSIISASITILFSKSSIARPYLT